MRDRLFEIWFSLRCGIANREFGAVLEAAGNAYAVFTADENELERMPCGDKLKRRLADKSLDEASRILEYCRANNVRLLFWQDEDYPASLRTLLDPPVLLYYTGKLPDFAHLLCISIVGTRKMSEYGKRTAYRIGYETAAAGVVVVSGLALGIDSTAAAGAIASGGCTVAVLGCGIDITYPAEHAELRRAVEGCGAVLTEFPPSTPPEGKNFPVRNRIISGLSQGTVVVEADLRSGALITARTAILQGRDIYAVPGNVGESNTEGTNRLIRDGAVAVLRARDLIDNYAFLYRDVISYQRLTNAEKHSDPDPEVFDRLDVHYRTIPARPSEKTQPATNAPLPAVPPASPAPSPARQPRPKSRPAPTDSPAAPSAPSAATRRETASPAAHSPRTAADRTPVTDSDLSETALRSLSESQRRLFDALPLDHAVPIDALVREGFSMGEIMAGMTLLEVKGLVVSLPGGLYSRK